MEVRKEDFYGFITQDIGKVTLRKCIPGRVGKLIDNVDVMNLEE
jgi:hypothetical protein